MTSGTEMLDCAKKLESDSGAEVFDLISTGDLIVLAIAGTATALVIIVAHWWQARAPRRGEEDAPPRS